MSAGVRFDECLAAASTWLRVHALTTTLGQYEQQSNKRNILAYCETHRKEQHQQHHASSAVSPLPTVPAPSKNNMVPMHVTTGTLSVFSELVCRYS